MRTWKSQKSIITAAALFIGLTPVAHAQVGIFMWIDREAKKSIKEANATPGHAAWCARNHPGYVKKWNHYKRPNGRVVFCASPFYTPPWKRGFKKNKKTSPE